MLNFISFFAIAIILADELITLIYTAVEVLGGLAFVVLFLSYILHKIKTSNKPKVYETSVDKKNELKMIVKDDKHKKVIVKGALSTKESKKSKTSVSSSSRSKPSSSSSRRSGDKEIKRHRSSSSSSKKKISSRAKEIKRSNRAKKMPGRDTRIHILNKLSNTTQEEKPKNQDSSSSSKKFYDITSTED